MSEIIQNIILLFVLALLAGFMIGYFIRRHTYKKRYIDEIAALNEEHDDIDYLYNQSMQKDKDIQNKYAVTHEIHETQKSLLHDISKKKQDTAETTETLTHKQHSLREAIAQSEDKANTLQAQIEALSSDLDIINEGKRDLHKQQEQIDLLHEALDNTKIQIQSCEEEIQAIKDDRLAIKTHTEQMLQEINKTQKSLRDTQAAVTAISKKHHHQLSDLRDVNDDLKITALNYEYALKEYQSPESESAHKKTKIEHLVKKNDQTRLLDKVIRALLRKPKLPTEEL